MSAAIIAFLLSLSFVSDWIKRRSVDFLEGDMMERKHAIQWGTCRSLSGNRTDRYLVIFLPSWDYAYMPWKDQYAWARRALMKFGPLPWHMTLFFE